MMLATKIILSNPAMILEGEKRYLIITDLHLGFESGINANEIFVGKNTTIHEIIAEIKQIIDNTKPDTLILLGDIKSSIKSISKNEWNDIPLFFDEIHKKIDIILVPGNHDSNIQRLVPQKTIMTNPTGLVLEDILLTHGHTMPSENFAHINRIIMGHIHPIFFEQDSILNGKRVWVYLKAKKHIIFPSQKGDIEIIIMPSFNKYLYATHKHNHKRSISPIIEKIKKISSARIVTLEGAIIGNKDMIKNVL